MISFSDEVFYLGMLGDHGKLAAVDRNGSVSWGELASRVVAATDFYKGQTAAAALPCALHSPGQH